MEPAPEAARAAVANDRWKPLFHRWFIEYNPLYLVSAGLVLAGTFLLSRGLANADLVGAVGVAAITEAYALVLIGGAALLMRAGHRRASVLLALLAVLYQGDLTLLTDSAALLGPWGEAVAGTWLALFAFKVVALTWAMRLRASFAALATAALGAVGLVVLPQVLSRIHPSAAAGALGLWAVALSTMQRHAHVESRVALDDWASVVLRRAVRATWWLWTLLVALHLAFWSSYGRLDLTMLLPVVPLLAIRRIRDEARVWILTLATLLFTWRVMPYALSSVAIVAAAALVARALQAVDVRRVTSPAASAAPEPPYRAPAREDVLGAISEHVLVAPDTDARRRLLVGAVLCGYVSLWTLGWRGGAWPEHVLGLDAALTASLALLGLLERRRSVVAPAVASWTHVAWAFVPLPRSPAAWGITCVTLGFVLLGGSLLVAWAWRAPWTAHDGA